MRDFSEYLSLPNKLDIEESNWLANPHLHERQARAVNEMCEKYKLENVVEIGCSTGNLFGKLGWDNIKSYVGYDSNEASIKLAKEKYPQFAAGFHVQEIRSLISAPTELIFCFAFLKHFGLHEWQMIFEKCASLGQYFIFDMQVAEETKDDGIEFHHVWKSIDGLNKSIYDAGLTLIKVYDGDPVAPIFVCRHKSVEPQKKKK